MDKALTRPVITLDIRDILSQLGIEESKWHDFNNQSLPDEQAAADEQETEQDEDHTDEHTA